MGSSGGKSQPVFLVTSVDGSMVTLTTSRKRAEYWNATDYAIVELEGTLIRPSLNQLPPDLDDLRASAAANCPGEHRPVQHRDGRRPWCNHCSKDEYGNPPFDRPGKSAETGA